MNAASHRFRRRGHARAGMVLLEVVVALFIFITVAFSLVLALNSAFDAAMDRNQIDAATRGLANQMELLHSARLVPGESDQPDDGSGILYHVSIATAQMQDQKKQFIPNMYRATITGTWKSGNQSEEQSVTELIYQP